MTTYDYSELLGELGAEVIYGVLDKNETIQVLREDRGIYKPIVDWYYSDERMEETLEELPPSHRENYEKIKSRLQKMSVADVMEEMAGAMKSIGDK